ncbi:MAG TPA: hypothetical protein VF210_05645 [Pseudomonadales bacterium]
MYDVVDFLGTIAEFSIGLAGFAGIVAALAKYRQPELALVRFRLANLLVSSFAPGFFALLTFGLVASAMEVGTALRVSSSALAAGLFLWAVLVHTRRPAELSRTLLFAMSVVTTVNLVIQLASATGLTGVPAASYLVGLMLLLLQGAVVFVVLVMDALQLQADG